MSYREAIQTINSTQLVARTDRPPESNPTKMLNYLERIGISVEDIDNLNIIYVTGTKGKGSTCAFVESILRQHGYKTGMYNTAHLFEFRERIRIDGRPVTKELFAETFWKVFEKLVATKTRDMESLPFYFAYAPLVAYHIFVHEKVDVAIVEASTGRDNTYIHVMEKPVVCGISSLDLDDFDVKGKQTLEDLAQLKADIFKIGAIGLTVPQPDSCLSVILSRANERGCPLYVAPPLTKEELSAMKLQLGIPGDCQRYNAALAVQLCRAWMDQVGNSFEERVLGCEDQSGVQDVSSIPQKPSTQLSREMKQGLAECRWPGRAQTIWRRGVTYYLDSTHTREGFQHCAEWFQQAADEEKNLKGRVCRALVFNSIGKRPGSELLPLLKGCGFDRAAFCLDVVSTNPSDNLPDTMDLRPESKDPKNCTDNRDSWDGRFVDEDASPACESDEFPCIASALCWATQNQDKSFLSAVSLSDEEPNGNSCGDTANVPHIQVLVTGSLYLVGGVLQLLTPNMNT